MAYFIQVFISLFSIMNPLLAITIYLDITRGLNKAEKRTVAIICGASVFAILIGVLLVGQGLMDVLGIHTYSLRLAGGLLVLLIGISMIMKPGESKNESKDGSADLHYNQRRIKTLGISPLALPMVVGPASIVMVILYGQQEPSVIGKFVVAMALLTVSISVIVVFILADYIARAIGEVGIMVLTKIMGLIIAAIAFEMIVSGLQSVVPILAHSAG